MIRFILITLCVFWISVCNATEYTIGVVPQQNPRMVKQMWCPFINRLSEKTGLSLVFKTNANISEFELAVNRGEYDFVYLNPLQYVKSNLSQGYQAFAKATDTELRGILVVPNNSSFMKMEDIVGKEIVFPDRNSFAATLVTQKMLKQKGIKYTPIYVGSHQQVYSNIASELYEVGGGVEQTFESSPSYIQNKLKVIWTSPGYPPHAFAAHVRVPKEDVDKVLNHMKNFSQNDNEQVYLNLIHLKGIKEAFDSDWDSIRKDNWDGFPLMRPVPVG